MVPGNERLCSAAGCSRIEMLRYLSATIYVSMCVHHLPHSFADMPDHMTVEHPHARVIEIELHNEVSIRTNELSVSSLWVTRVDDGSVPRAYSFGEDLHVVTVHVHWVRSGEADAGQDNADGGVCAHVVDCSFLWEVEVVELCLKPRVMSVDVCLKLDQ